MTIIKKIALTGEVPKVTYYTDSDKGAGGSDCTYPSKDGEMVPPAASFESAVQLLTDALIDEYLEMGADEDRVWGVRSVTYKWDEEKSEYGFSLLTVGNRQGSACLKVTVDETSPDQITPKVYTALEKLKYEAVRYINGVSAQLNLLEGNDEEIEEAA